MKLAYEKGIRPTSSLKGYGAPCGKLSGVQPLSDVRRAVLPPKEKCEYQHVL